MQQAKQQAFRWIERHRGSNTMSGKKTETHWDLKKSDSRNHDSLVSSKNCMKFKYEQFGGRVSLCVTQNVTFSANNC